MSDTFRSILIGTVGLDSAAVVALVLTVRRPPRATAPRFLLLGWITLGLQGLHFMEELLTGFEVRFLSLLGVAGVLLFARLMAFTQPTTGVNMRREERV